MNSTTNASMPRSPQTIWPIGPTALAVAFAVALTGGCGPNPTPEPFPATLQARVSVLNKSREMHVLRVRNMRPEVRVDCERVAQAPTEYLSDDIFGPPVRWPLYSDQELGMGINNQQFWNQGDDLAGRRCSASLIESDTVADIVIFWDDTIDPKTFEFDPDIPEYIKPDPQTVVLRGDYDDVPSAQVKPYRYRPCDDDQLCGAAGEAEAAEIPTGADYYWEDVGERPLHYERPWRPDERPQQIAPECEMPGPGEALVWDDRQPNDNWNLIGIDAGIDGCHALKLELSQTHDQHREYLICAPIASLRPLVEGDYGRVALRFDPLAERDFDGLHIAADHYGSGGYIDMTTHVYLTRGSRLPPQAGVDAEVSPRAACAPVEAECGQIELPADVRVSSPGGDFQDVRPGQPASFDQGSQQIHLVRAVERPVVDAACEGDTVSQHLGGLPGTYLEAVSVVRY